MMHIINLVNSDTHRTEDRVVDGAFCSINCNIPITPAFGSIIRATTKAPSTTLSSVLWVSEFSRLMICIISFCQYIRYVQAATTIRNKWVCSLMRGVDFSRLIHAGMHSSCSLTRSRRPMAWLITEYTYIPLMPTPSPHSSQ